MKKTIWLSLLIGYLKESWKKILEEPKSYVWLGLTAFFGLSQVVITVMVFLGSLGGSGEKISSFDVLKTASEAILFFSIAVVGSIATDYCFSPQASNDDNRHFHKDVGLCSSFWPPFFIVVVAALYYATIFFPLSHRQTSLTWEWLPLLGVEIFIVIAAMLYTLLFKVKYYSLEKGSLSLEFSVSSLKKNTIRVYACNNHESDKPLNLNVKDFEKGIQMLGVQIRESKIEVDACIGINDAGMIMATFLNFDALRRKKIGYIRFEGYHEGQEIEEENCFFPKKLRDENPIILLTDFEIKTGAGIEKAIGLLRKNYKEPKIYFAVFGAAIKENKELQIKDLLADLESSEILSKCKIEDIFMACTMRLSGIEPPFGLR